MKILFTLIIALIFLTCAHARETSKEPFMNNTFEIKSWDEAPYLELGDNSKYSRAKLVKEYKGVMHGTGQLDYLMTYNADGDAHFVGIEHFEGEVSGKAGTFSITHKGSFTKGMVTSSFEIVDGSQTNQLSNLQGKGNYTTGHAMLVNFDFDYTL